MTDVIFIVIACLLSIAVSLLILFLVAIIVQEIHNHKKNHTYYINNMLKSPNCYSIVPLIKKIENENKKVFQDLIDVNI